MIYDGYLKSWTLIFMNLERTRLTLWNKNPASGDRKREHLSCQGQKSFEA